VILELGFSDGHLGWDTVFVLYRSPPRVFPKFERPSDLDGVVFDHVDEAGRWKECSRATLQERGFALERSGEPWTVSAFGKRSSALNLGATSFTGRAVSCPFISCTRMEPKSTAVPKTRLAWWRMRNTS
jgi:hypothetical protein